MTPLKALPALLLILAAGLAFLVPTTSAATNCAATYGPGYVGTGAPATGDACVNATSAGCFDTLDVGLNGKCFPSSWLDCSRYGPGYIGSDHSADVCVDPTGCPAGKVGVYLNGNPACVVGGTDCAAKYGPGYVGAYVATVSVCVSPGGCPSGGTGINGACGSPGGCSPGSISLDPACLQDCSPYPGSTGVNLGGTRACAKLNECSSRSVSVNGQCVDLTIHRTDCAEEYGPGYVGTGFGARTNACVRICTGDSIGAELDGQRFCF